MLYNKRKSTVIYGKNYQQPNQKSMPYKKSAPIAMEKRSLKKKNDEASSVISADNAERNFRINVKTFG